MKASAPGTGIGAHRLAGLQGPEIGQELEDILGKSIGAVQHLAAKRARRSLIGAWRPAETEIDPAGK